MLAIGKKLDVLMLQPSNLAPSIDRTSHLSMHTGLPVNHMQGPVGAADNASIGQADLIREPPQQIQQNLPMPQNINGAQGQGFVQPIAYIPPNIRYNSNPRTFVRYIP